MAVHSVRLPDDLWWRLGEALATANVGRRRPITLSTLLRGLIERGLLHPDGLEEIGSKIVCPPRVLKQKMSDVVTAAAEAAQAAFVIERIQVTTSLFSRVRQIVKFQRISARKFIREIITNFSNLSDREDKLIINELHDFYNGLISDESAISNTTLDAVQRWLQQQEGPQVFEDVGAPALQQPGGGRGETPILRVGNGALGSDVAADS